MEHVFEQHRACLGVAIQAVDVGEADFRGAVEHDIHAANAVRQWPEIRPVILRKMVLHIVADAGKSRA